MQKAAALLLLLAPCAWSQELRGFLYQGTPLRREVLTLVNVQACNAFDGDTQLRETTNNVSVPSLPLGCSWGSLSGPRFQPRAESQPRLATASNGMVTMIDPFRLRGSVTATAELRRTIAGTHRFTVRTNAFTDIANCTGTGATAPGFGGSIQQAELTGPSRRELTADTGECSVAQLEMDRNSLVVNRLGRTVEFTARGRVLGAFEIEALNGTTLASGARVQVIVEDVYKFAALPRLDASISGGLTLSETAGRPGSMRLSLVVANTGGGTLAWNAVVTAVSGGNWLRLARTAGSVEHDQTAEQVEITADSEKLAPGEYRARLTITAPGAADSPRTFELVLRQASGGDLLSMSQVTPTADTTLEPGGEQTFTAQVDYTLGTRDSAALALEVVDEAGARIAASASRTVSRGNGSESFDVRAATPHDKPAIGLRANLADASSGQLLLHSAPVTYRAAVRDRISLVARTLVPGPEAAVSATDLATVRATVEYSLGSAAEGTVALLVLRGTQVVGTGQAPVTRTTSAGGSVAVTATLSAPVEADELTVVAVLRGAANAELARSEPARYLFVPELSISRIEAVQVVQDAANNLPLVAGKRLLVRVFVEQVGQTARPVQGIAATVRAFLPNGDSFLGLQSGADAIDWTPQPDRNQAAHSLNFDISERFLARVTDDRTALRLEASLRLRDTSRRVQFRDNPKTVEVVLHRTFLPDSPFRVGYRRVVVEEDGTRLAPVADPAGRADMAQRLFPLADGALTYEPSLLPDLVWRKPVRAERPVIDLDAELEEALEDEITNDLARIDEEERRTAVGGSRHDQMVWWLPNLPLGYGGASNPYWNGGKSRIAAIVTAPNLTDRYYRRVVAHEIAHNLGLPHPSTGPEENARLLGLGCQVAASSRPIWIYPTQNVQETGADPHDGRIVPDSFFDFMGYCPEDRAWISPFHYHQLFQQFLRLRDDPARQPADVGVQPVPGARRAASRAAEALPILIVRGWAERDGSAGALSSATRIASDLPADEGTGASDYCLVQLEGDREAATHCFQMTFTTANLAVRRRQFLQVVGLAPGTTRLSLRCRGTELAALEAGGLPQLTVESPQGGETWTGRQRIAWTGSHPDGGQIIYRVFYSANRENWQPISFDIENSELFVDTGQLPAAGEAWFRVVALRGLEAAEAIAGPVMIEHQPRLEVAGTLGTLGAVAVGREGARELVVRNTGVGPLMVRAIRSTHPAFTVTAPALPFAVPTGSQRAIRVLFQPADVGPQQTSLEITSSDGRPTPHLVTAEGVGLDPAGARLTIEPAQLGFAATPVGEARGLSVRLANYGAGVLRVEALTVEGAAFQTAGLTTPFELAPAEAKDLTVTFRPAAAGSVSGLLRVRSNDAARPSVEVRLTGQGTGSTPPPPVAGNPVPTVVSIAPDAVVAGGAAFVLTVDGTGFVSASVVEWNGVPRTTTFVSATRVTAAISAADIAAAGTAAVTVRTPVPGGGRSSPMTLRIAGAPAPPAPAQPDLPHLRVQQLDFANCPQVSVYASVVGAASPPPLLNSTTVSCSVNGETTRCAVLPPEQPLSSVILVSLNGLGGADADAVKNAARTLVNLHGPDDRVSVIHVETVANPIRGFTANKALLLATIDSLRPVGDGLALYDAISLAASQLASEAGRRQAVFVLASGANRDGSIQDAAIALQRAAAIRAPFFAVSSAPAASPALDDFLPRLAGETFGYAFEHRAATAAAAAMGTAWRSLAEQTVVTYSLNTPAAHTLALTYRGPAGTFTAQRAIPACR